MRVLILGSKEYPFGISDDKISSGGMEAYTQELANQLVKLGTKSIIVTRQFKNLRNSEIVNELEIHRVKWLRGFWFRGPSFNFFSFLKSLKLDFDVILTNGIQATFFGYILSKIKNKPLVAIPHGTAHTQNKYGGGIGAKIAYMLEKFSYSKANLILLSKEEAQKFETIFGIKKYTIIPTPVNTEKFKFGRKLSRNEIKIAFIGRLAEVKGVKYLLEAIPLLKGKFKIVIVGSGPDEDKLKKLAGELKLGSKVKFTGFRKDVAAILSSADIFVLPSLSEGLPIALLEAMAAGCACVVTKIFMGQSSTEIQTAF
ncbi:MAG: glycosyltransferase family 4 protein [DPANN group archaeon]|nr:glycosyltransferase family 4 protein [DPANN group archaeon]